MNTVAADARYNDNASLNEARMSQRTTIVFFQWQQMKSNGLIDGLYLEKERGSGNEISKLTVK